MVGKAETETDAKEQLKNQHKSECCVVADSELAGSPVESRQQGQFKY